MNSIISSGNKLDRLMDQDTVKQSGSFRLAAKLKDYMLLVKFNLSFMVVFSAVVSCSGASWAQVSSTVSKSP